MRENNKANLIIKKVVSTLSKIDGVAALVLAGSRVKGNKFQADKFSDIELYVVSFDKDIHEVEQKVQSIQKVFGNKVVLAYKNQWAGWSILFKDLLRLELPLVKSSDKDVFSRPSEQKIEILYSKLGFKLKIGNEPKPENKTDDGLNNAIKDFWYMATYAAQHIGRGEVFLARDAIKVSMQGKVIRLLQEYYHKDMLRLELNRRLELTWSKDELNVLKETSSAYDRDDIVRSFWANINYVRFFLVKMGRVDLFDEYSRKLTPQIRKIID